MSNSDARLQRQALKQDIQSSMIAKEPISSKIELSPDKTSILNVEGEDFEKITRFHEEGEGNIVMEPFNLNQEKDEGHFDSQGNYVPHSRKGQEFDRWADDLEDYVVDESKKSVQLSNTVTTTNTNTSTSKNLQTTSVNSNSSIVISYDEKQLLERLRKLLKKGESIRNALIRYSNQKAITEAMLPSNRESGNLNSSIDNNKQASNVDSKLKKPSKFQEKRNKMRKHSKVDSKEFNELTEIAYQLTELGYSDVYDDDRILLKRFIPQDNSKPIQAKEEDLWYYKLISDEGIVKKGQRDQIYGPFSQEQMVNFWKSGYFTGLKVMCKKEKFSADEADEDFQPLEEALMKIT